MNCSSRHPILLILITSFISLLFWNTPVCLAGGVTGNSGTVNNSGAGVSAGSGSNASNSITVNYSIPIFMAIGIYDATGNNSNSLFSSPTSNFPGGTTFTAAEGNTILVANEGNLNSKFDLDGITSSADATAIFNLMNANTNVNSQNLIIKGAVVTNASILTTLFFSITANSVIMTGGTGSAPRIDFRAMAGVPGGGGTRIVRDTTPASALSITALRRNSNGYARILVVGDIRETSVNFTTKGNWTASTTLTLTGL